MKTPLQLLVLHFLFFITTHSVAMWAGMSDSQLVKQSDLIVKASYIGASTVTIKDNPHLLGVLEIKETLKGSQKIIAIIRIPSHPANTPQRSDTVNLEVGQKGLWFLEKDSTLEGVYMINRPDRFIPESQFENRLPRILELLH